MPCGGKRGQCQNQQKNQGIPHPVPFARRLCRSGIFRLVRKGLHRQHICRDRPAVFLPACPRRLRQTGCSTTDHVQQPERRGVAVCRGAHPAALTTAKKQHRILRAFHAPGGICRAGKALRGLHAGKRHGRRPALDPAGLCVQLCPGLFIRVAHGTEVEHPLGGGHGFQPRFQQRTRRGIGAHQQPAAGFQRLHGGMDEGCLPFPVQFRRKLCVQLPFCRVQPGGRCRLQRKQSFCALCAALRRKAGLLCCQLHALCRNAEQAQYADRRCGCFFFVVQSASPPRPGAALIPP